MSEATRCAGCGKLAPEMSVNAKPRRRKARSGTEKYGPRRGVRHFTRCAGAGQLRFELVAGPIVLFLAFY